eukprot:354080-Chlamydomonas_euryale.AAC.1
MLHRCHRRRATSALPQRRRRGAAEGRRSWTGGAHCPRGTAIRKHTTRLSHRPAARPRRCLRVLTAGPPAHATAWRMCRAHGGGHAAEGVGCVDSAHDGYGVGAARAVRLEHMGTMLRLVWEVCTACVGRAVRMVAPVA